MDSQPKQYGELAALDQRLDQLTTQIAHHRSLSFRSVSVTVILTVLTVMSLAQTLQAWAILDRVNELGPAPAAAATVAAQPQNVSNLPNMVGGC
ncbi:MAG: hypothetical protein A3J59_03940 [Candidatus Buchananbacteria bacterium RIFCSPHIGHO2_02_FULL_56_16]|uniref:Uncharacterized protein n=1 Tax=Candidatus Buchananbacteria bacterium RIFCSPHIGHO2_02_FULL_56_16 TaxID=1797542 RepID=A0A1G1YIC2_9BACT|nr:MAG: hypothetical protein A3J59_03940 [Candidatus Buchananbacteria bacterium RIFCSPHIGHO2_02_FULL_56_16]